MDTIEASAPIADNSPQLFEGHKTDFGDPCAADSPGQSLIIFYDAIVDANYQVKDFDIKLKANVFPTIVTANHLGESWAKVVGPTSGSLNQADTFEVIYQNPKVGGLYKFEFDLGLSGCAKSGANVDLPLAGAAIDTWLEGEVRAMKGRASSWQDNVYLNSPIAGIEIYKNKVFAMISAYYFDYVGQARNADGTSPCEQYSHGDTKFYDPAYVTLSGVVVHRSKINNMLWAVFGRNLGYPEAWLKAGAFYNQAFQKEQKLDIWTNIVQFIDSPSSQNAIGLGSSLYENNSVSEVISANKAREMQAGGTLFDQKLWPCSHAMDPVSSTLHGPYNTLPTKYIEYPTENAE